MATIDSEALDHNRRSYYDINLITEIIDTVGTLPTLAATFAGLFTAVRGIKIKTPVFLVALAPKWRRSVNCFPSWCWRLQGTARKAV